ncbi:MAG: cupin domain-containing protein [bacterium]|nr:cupin domain-containing protein [bacterium]
MPQNLFSLPDPLPNRELFEPLFPDAGILVERIVSTGQSTPPGEWHDQDRDEWVVLLQGKAVLSYEDGQTLSLQPGDHTFIPAHKKHRVESTSTDPPCIWLAVHGKLLQNKAQSSEPEM